MTNIHQNLFNKHEGSIYEPLGATYHLELPLSVTYASPNFELILGIAHKHIINNPDFWRERLFPSDLEKFAEGIRLCQNGKTFSMSHYIMNDQGLPMWIGHHINGSRSDHKTFVVGCVIPIHKGTNDSPLECAVIRKFVHKLGNHFQLLGLLLNSISQSPTNKKQLQSAQNTLEQAIELTRVISEYSQPLDETSTVNLNSVLQKVVNESALQESPITIDTQALTSMQATLHVVGDPFAFETTIQTLIDETRKLVEAGKPLRVHLTHLGKDPNSRHWMSILISASNKAPSSAISPQGRHISTLNTDDSELSRIILVHRYVELLGGTLFLYNKSSEMGPAMEITIPVINQI